MRISKVERYNEEGVKVSISLGEVLLFAIAVALWVMVLWGMNIAG